MSPKETSAPTKALLRSHYDALLGTGGPGPSPSVDFLLYMAGAEEARGKDVFSGNLFFKLARSLDVKTMIIEGGRACAVVDYGLVSPNGDRLSCVSAEIWSIENGTLKSLEMYYDTAAYQKFTLPILFPLARLKRKGRSRS